MSPAHGGRGSRRASSGTRGKRGTAGHLRAGGLPLPRGTRARRSRVPSVSTSQKCAGWCSQWTSAPGRARSSASPASGRASGRSQRGTTGAQPKLGRIAASIVERLSTPRWLPIVIALAAAGAGVAGEAGLSSLVLAAVPVTAVGALAAFGELLDARAVGPVEPAAALETLLFGVALLLLVAGAAASAPTFAISGCLAAFGLQALLRPERRAQASGARAVAPRQPFSSGRRAAGPRRTRRCSRPWPRRLRS